MERFVRPLVREGRLRIGAAPKPALSDAELDDVKAALAAQTLDIPGPPIRGSLDSALAALHVVYRFGWRALNADPKPAADDATLRMPHPPRTVEEHLGADLALRFLAGVRTRLIARDPMDELAAAATRLLREWPFSGVLAEIEEPPTSPADFGGHLGMGYTYAERLAARQRVHWLPDGVGRECVEIVWPLLGTPAPARIETTVHGNDIA